MAQPRATFVTAFTRLKYVRAKIYCYEYGISGLSTQNFAIFLAPYIFKEVKVGKTKKITSAKTVFANM